VRYIRARIICFYVYPMCVVLRGWLSVSIYSLSVQLICLHFSTFVPVIFAFSSKVNEVMVMVRVR